MIQLRELLDTQVKNAIRSGEFDGSIRCSSRCVAVIMTQDWCPQWLATKRWLEALKAKGEPVDLPIEVYELIYNRKDYFAEFLRFKEGVWNNNQIPYIRYYIQGTLSFQSNYVSAEQFLSSFRSLES